MFKEEDKKDAGTTVEKLNATTKENIQENTLLKSNMVIFLQIKCFNTGIVFLEVKMFSLQKVMSVPSEKDSNHENIVSKYEMVEILPKNEQITLLFFIKYFVTF